jgi:mono/diheme cytochrome c family protein
VVLAKVAVVVCAVVALAGALAACGGDEQPIPSDPVLARGQDVYRKNCAQCHGSRGGGGSGVKLAGVVAARYPDIADHVAVIRDGRTPGMPAFGDRLSAEDIDAVARWEREGF